MEDEHDSQSYSVGDSEEDEIDLPYSVPKMDYAPHGFTGSCLLSHSRLSKEGKIIGFYTQRERANKISHFRAKMNKRKEEVPVIKSFQGRSRCARIKPRKCGKFVKSELAHLYTLTQEQKLERTKKIDQFMKEGNYECALEYLIEY